MKILTRNAAAFVLAAGLGLVATQASAQTILPAQQIDPAEIYGAVKVNFGDSAEFSVAVPTDTFLSILQRDTSINVDSQFRIVSVAAPKGLKILSDNSSGTVFSLERSGDDLKLLVNLMVSADGVGPGSYPVLITLENLATGARMPVGVMVTVL